MPCVTSSEATPTVVAFLRMFYLHSLRFMAVTDQSRATFLNVSAYRVLGHPLLPLPIFASHNDVARTDLCWSNLLTWTSWDAVHLPRLSGSLSPGTGRPRVEDWGMVSNIEGSCEYIEQTVADGRQEVILILGVERGANIPSP